MFCRAVVNVVNMETRERSNVTATTYIDSRTIGSAEITVISDGELLWEHEYPAPEAEWRAALPDADAKGRIWIGLNVMLVRLGDALVLIDPGCDDPDSAWQRELSNIWPDWPTRRTPGFAAGLAELGVSPDAITHVLITHPHGDHYAGVLYETENGLAIRFPNARHFMGRADWEGNPNRGKPGAMLDRLEVIDRAGLLELVDTETEVAPGVTMIPAPGESPGHCLVRIASGDETAVVLGDLIHHGIEVQRPHWYASHCDVDAIRAARDRFYPLLANGQLLFFSHEPFPGWGTIVAEEDGYRWQRENTSIADSR